MSILPSLVQRAAESVRALAGPPPKDRSGRALARDRKFAASLVASAADAICAFDETLRIIEWNPAMSRLTGVARDQALGRHGATLDVTADWTAPGGAWPRALTGETTVVEDQPFGRRTGEDITYVHAVVAPLFDADGYLLGGVMTLRDVSEKVVAAEMLRASEMKFRALFDQAAMGIVVLDLDDVVRDVNPAFERLMGFTAAELIGRRSRDLSPPEDAVVTREPVREIYAGRRRSVTVEKRYVRKDGEIRWASLTFSRIAAFGHDVGLVGMAHDVTERKALEEQLEHQAFHDPLTGLGNRTLFRDRVERALARAGEEAERVAVIYLDLDDFKKVNDSLGHAEGDRLLQIVSERLLNATRGCDTVSRLGGDEFAILVENVRISEDVLIVADRIVQAMRQPVGLEGKEVFVGGSVGVARASRGDDADALLRNADVAMYEAKNGGKGRHAVFAREMHAAALERLELEADLRHAVGRGELRLRYQPIVELQSSRVVGAEALLRWEHPTRGMLQPLSFLPLAEETGLIVPVGQWVLHEACRQAAAWERALFDQHGAHGPASRFTITVNVSGRQLQEESFLDDVASALAISGLTPGRLLLEITESVFMEQDDVAIERLRRLKDLGIRLGIDDFGTGYSSLGYLQRFPVDVLKIDKSFVDGVAQSGSDAALARAIIALGEMLSLRTVAEGVARPQQQARLQALGCELGQGFLFAEPLTAEEVERMLNDV